MVSNREIGRLLSLYAELLQMHQKDEKLSSFLTGAAYKMRNIQQDVFLLSKKELTTLFRPELIALIEEIQKTGSIEGLDELIQLTPGGLFDMMRIRGLGGKKLAVIWKVAGIDNVEHLLEACKEGRLSKIAGFGAKTQDNIITAIEALHSNSDHFHYASVADYAIELEQHLQKFFKTKLISLCGDIRRKTTTVTKIELVVAITSEKFKTTPRKLLHINSSSISETTGHTIDEIPFTVYHTDKKSFYYELFKRTGNEQHVNKVSGKLKIKEALSEEAIYKAAGLPFVVPEMREDLAEWDFKENDSLLALKDIKGVVHNHTNWSDGINSLADFVKACRNKKFEYVVISDHSKNAHYAGGLKEDKVLAQLQEIEKLNKELAPFKIFKSIECDILVSGELDYSTDILERFDLVIVSIHQLLKMDEKKATARLIKAIENPFTTILGHMTGRQLLIRPGYPVDFTKVIDACAANHVVIEINANPYRLDMDWSHIPYALQKGVMISVNPDAHSIAEIDNIRWGVEAARKGGLTKEMTWNARNLKGIEKWLQKYRKSTGQVVI